MKIPPKINEALLASIDVSGRTIEIAFKEAGALVAAGGFEPAVASQVPETGSKFRIPLLLPELLESGDGRKFDKDSLSTRNLPLPLLWQIKTGNGHDGSVIVGRIDSIETLSAGEDSDEITGLGEAVGVFDTGPYGREAERLVRGKFLRGVSADLDMFEASVDAADELSDDTEDEPANNKIKNDKITVTTARLMAATLVPKPAFQECTIELVEDMTALEFPIEDGMYEEASDDVENAFAALAASAAPVVPPREWFKNPELKQPTPITVTDDGRVFGHIAAWHVDHIGLPRATKPPRSASNYAYFRTGLLKTTEGDVPVGQLTLAGGHAPLNATAQLAAKHYDDTASAIADVAAGEDQFGIYVAGALRPEATPEQVRALRASAPSGDWRPINGRLELVAVCQVNVPGFPIARAMVAGGQMMALVAAGARPIAELREQPILDLQTRLQELEAIEFQRTREQTRLRLASLIEESDNELAMAASAASERLSSLIDESDAELSIKLDEARSRLESLLEDN